MSNNKIVIMNPSRVGKVGKSTFASAFLEVLRYLDQKVDAYTLDRGHQQLYHRYGETKGGVLVPIEQQNPSKGVGFADLREKASRQALLNRFDEDSKSDFFLLDFPADSLDDLHKFFGSAEGLIEFFGDDFQVTFTPVVACRDSLNSALSLKDMFGKAPRYIICINEGLMNKRGAEALIPEVYQAFAKDEKLILNHEFTPKMIDLFEEPNFKKLYEIHAPTRTNENGDIVRGASILQGRLDRHIAQRTTHDLEDQIKDMFNIQ